MENDVKTQLNYLGLGILKEEWDQIIKKATKQKQSYSSFLKTIVTKEYQAKCEKARLARVKKAKIPEVLTIDTFPFTKQPKLKQKLIFELYDSLTFLKEKQDLIFIGPTGCGKTGLATSFLVHAINQGYRGRFFDFTELIGSLYSTRGDHTEDKYIKRLLSYDIILIDELGYISCEQEEASLFFDLMRKRFKKGTTIITTQLGFNEWGSFLANNHLVAALLDRITANCVVFNMKDCISIRDKKIIYATKKQEEPPAL